jgi:hypothetical protein
MCLLALEGSPCLLQACLTAIIFTLIMISSLCVTRA